MSRVPSCAVLALVLAFAPRSVDGQSIKLSAPLPPGGIVSEPEFTPDGQRVVYIAQEIFSVAADGSEPAVQLTSLPGGIVADPIDGKFSIAPGGERLLFLQSFGFGYLHSVEVAGGAPPVELHHQSGGDVFTPVSDGEQVLFYLSGGLYATSIQGGQMLVLSPPHDPDLEIAFRSFDFAAGERIVFFREEADGTHLYSVGNDGTGLIELDGPDCFPGNPILQNSTDRGRPELTPDRTRVVYWASQTDHVVLRSAAADGGSAQLTLNDADHLREFGLFRISPDGSRVVYLAGDFNQVVHLYSVPLDGSEGPVRLSGTMVQGGDVLDFEIAAGSARVAYVADQDTNGVFELYGAPIDGSQGAIRLSDPMVPDGGIPVQLPPGYGLSAFLRAEARISPDGTHVVYRADRDVNEIFELYSVPIDGSAPPVELNPSFHHLLFRDVFDFQITPDGERVVYRSNQQFATDVELWVVPIDRSREPRQLNGELVAHGAVSEYAISPDGRRVVYTADQDTDELVELYASPLRGAGKVWRWR